MKISIHSALPALNGFFILLLLSAPSVAADQPVSFRNDVMAVLSKAGCNAGQCHGNANGKASFKLSLRGESPELDYLALTHDQFSRRVDLLEADQSMILLKPTTQISHEGGQRFKTNSWEYKVLFDWIARGACNDVATAPKLKTLKVSPLEAILIEPTNQVRIFPTAIFTDGLTKEISSVAVYEAANPAIRISADGVVTSEQPAETTVLVRYLDQQVPVRLAFVAAQPGFVWKNPKSYNYIDRLVFAKLERVRLNPSELCSDETFVRRSSLDLIGKLPTAAEAKAFVYDPSPEKRKQWIDELLERPEFSDFWALKWSDLLRNEERILDRKGSEIFHRWVRESIHQHKPIDQFAREIIAARGSTYKNPPANFYRAARTPTERGEAAAQLFLGTRVQCAQCHNHPFDRWSQDDYYDWMSVFSRLQYKVLENRRRDSNDGHEFKGEQILFLASSGAVKNPRTGEAAHPRFLGGASRYEGAEDELTALAKWTTSPDNPFFARTQANRIWYHLFGRGIVEPIDDFRASNPPSNPELLDALAQDFVKHGYDLRALIRVIMNSRTYQASSLPDSSNENDEINFSHSLIRRLSAEQLLDCQSQVAGVPLHYTGYPEGTQAVELAGALPERKRDQKKAEVDTFMAEFGKPPRLLPSECERSCEPTMGQAFQLMSGPVLHQLLTAKNNRLEQLIASEMTEEQWITEIYWTALSRAPKAAEAAVLANYLKEHKDKRAALEDIFWSVMNSKEFLFHN